MSNEALITVKLAEGDGSDPIDALGERTFRLQIQAKDLRPFIFRRWSATVAAGLWSLDDPSFGAYFWRARSKEKLMEKGIRALLRKAHSLGIRNPVVIVEDPQPPRRPEHDFRVRGAAPVEASDEVEVIAPGAGSTP